VNLIEQEQNDKAMFYLH